MAYARIIITLEDEKVRVDASDIREMTGKLFFEGLAKAIASTLITITNQYIERGLEVPEGLLLDTLADFNQTVTDNVREQL